MLSDKLQYYTVIIFRSFLKITPKFILNYFLDLLGKLFYKIDKRHRFFVEANLKFAFNDKYSKEEIETISKKVFRNFARYLGYFLVSCDKSIEDFKKEIEVIDDYYLKDAINKNRKIIIISAHYGNWELIGKIIGLFYKPITVVGEKLYNSPSLDQMLTDLRTKNSMEMVPRMGAMRGLVKALKSDRIVGMVVDQNTQEQYGVLIDFFGKKARHTPSAAQLAKKFDAIIIPAFVSSVDYKKYTLKFYKPIEIENSDNSEVDIMKCVQKQADITQEVVINKPDEYFWFHRRWKNQYPEIYEIKK